MALGLTNLLVGRVVRKGWIRVIHVRPNRLRYFLTPAGMAEKSRMSRAYLAASVQFYRQARDRIQLQFAALSANWPGNGAAAALPKRIVFYGADEVAEIGYVCLAETDLQLVGVVDAVRTKPFFGMRVCTPEQLDGAALNGQPFEQLVVMSLGNSKALQVDLLALRVPLDRVFWL